MCDAGKIERPVFVLSLWSRAAKEMRFSSCKEIRAGYSALTPPDFLSSRERTTTCLHQERQLFDKDDTMEIHEAAEKIS